MEGSNITQEFLAKIDKGRSDGCWGWFGGSNEGGYSLLRGKPAHRFSYLYHWGIIPHGLFVCHDCDNRWCVNPFHLYCGTHVDNMRDRVKRRPQYRMLPHPSYPNGIADLLEEHGGLLPFAWKNRVIYDNIKNWMKRDTATDMSMKVLSRYGFEFERVFAIDT